MIQITYFAFPFAYDMITFQKTADRRFGHNFETEPL